MAYTLPGIDSLVLSMDVVVGMYNGTYKRWNDNRIRQLNPDVNLPAQDIIVVARAGK